MKVTSTAKTQHGISKDVLLHYLVIYSTIYKCNIIHTLKLSNLELINISKLVFKDINTF